MVAKGQHNLPIWIWQTNTGLQKTSWYDR